MRKFKREKHKGNKCHPYLWEYVFL